MSIVEHNPPATRHICFLTGTRADFGKLKPLIVGASELPGIRVTVLVTGMHLMPKYGSTVNEVRRLEPGVHIREFDNQTEGDSMDRILARTIEGLEAYTGKQWVRARRRDMVSTYAHLSWDSLLGRSGIGFKKAKQLLEMFAIAAKDLPPAA